MKNWHYLFEDKILGRGLSYMEDVEIDFRSDEKVTATVWGTEEYKTEITFDDGFVDEMYCSCPYFDIDNCKHLAALLFVLDENKKQDKPPVKKEDFTELFNSISSDDLNDFLFSELENDSELLNRFKLRFSDNRY